MIGGGGVAATIEVEVAAEDRVIPHGGDAHATGSGVFTVPISLLLLSALAVHCRAVSRGGCAWCMRGDDAAPRPRAAPVCARGARAHLHVGNLLHVPYDCT